VFVNVIRTGSIYPVLRIGTRVVLVKTIRLTLGCWRRRWENTPLISTRLIILIVARTYLNSWRVLGVCSIISSELGTWVWTHLGCILFVAKVWRWRFHRKIALWLFFITIGLAFWKLLEILNDCFAGIHINNFFLSLILSLIKIIFSVILSSSLAFSVPVKVLFSPIWTLSIVFILSAWKTFTISAASHSVSWIEAYVRFYLAKMTSHTINWEHVNVSGLEQDL